MNQRIKKRIKILAWFVGVSVAFVVLVWLMLFTWEQWDQPDNVHKRMRRVETQNQLSAQARAYYAQHHYYPASMRELERFIEKNPGYRIYSLYYKKPNNVGYGIAYADLSLFLPQLQTLKSESGYFPVGFPNCKGTPLYQATANQQAFFITACDRYGALIPESPVRSYYKDKEVRSKIIVDMQNKKVYNFDILRITNPSLFKKLYKSGLY